MHTVYTKTYNEAVLGDFLAHIDFCDEFITELVCTLTSISLIERTASPSPIKKRYSNSGGGFTIYTILSEALI